MRHWFITGVSSGLGRALAIAALDAGDAVSGTHTTGGSVGFYSSTKMALEGLSKALSHELAPFGIKVMIAVPGAYRTDLGLNRKTPVETIADYAEQNVVRGAFLSKLSGQQRGDPRKAAAVILDAVNANAIPFYLPLGPDAVESITKNLGLVSEDVKTWETQARSTDLETA